MSSQKINTKNLTYSQNVPPFLAALRGQVGGQTGPDPILAAHRRPIKQRSTSEEAEDAPLVLDEHGDVVADVTVGADGIAKVAGAIDELRRNEAKEGGGNRLSEGVAAGVGVEKKRKVGKLISVSEEGEEEGQRRSKHTAADSLGKDNEDAKSVVSANKIGTRDKKRRKGSKKIKMSFEDDGEV